MSKVDLTDEHIKHWNDFFQWFEENKHTFKKCKLALCVNSTTYCFSGLLCRYYAKVVSKDGLAYFDALKPEAFGNGQWRYPFMTATSTYHYGHPPQEVLEYFGLSRTVSINLYWDNSVYLTIAALNDATDATLEEIAAVIKRDLIERDENGST